MANITIPNLPSAIALTGSEQVEVVQSNTSVRTTTQAIANLATVNVNAITSLTINSPLYASGSNPITSTGSIGLSSSSVTNNYLGTMPTLTLKGNNTGSTAAPTDLSVASVMTMLGAAPLASPTFTGTPRAPTPATSDNSTQIATTAFVKAQAIPSSFTRTTITASGGQTTFSVSYSVGSIQVYLNGVMLAPSDYTATSGTSVVLGLAAAAGDIFDAFSFAPQNTTGIVPVVNGGSGTSSLSGYVYGNGTSPFTASTTIPATALSGILAAANGGTGVASTSLMPVTATGSTTTRTLGDWTSELAGTAVAQNNVSAWGFNASQYGFGGNYANSYGSVWQTQFHANWNVVQTQVPYNPTEWQVYTNAANGIVKVTSGTNQVTLVSGTPFDSAWVGKPFFYFEGMVFKVLAVTDSSHLTVQTTGGGSVSWGATANGTYYYCTTSTSGTVNTNGTSVTLLSGQPFINFAGTSIPIVISGVSYTIASWNSGSSLTLSSSAGIQNGAPYSQNTSIANELANLRLQGLAGADEENFVITLAPSGTTIQSAYAGAGKYRPIWVSTGENPIGSPAYMIGMHPNGTLGNPGWLTLGGDNGQQAIYIPQNSNNVNYMYMAGGPTTFAPSIAARGSDTNVSLSFDVQGASTITFSSHSYTNTEFQVFGVGGSSWLAVGSSFSAAPTLTANGSAANIDIQLLPKSGYVWLGAYTVTAPTATGYISVKDSGGNIRKLLCA